MNTKNAYRRLPNLLIKAAIVLAFGIFVWHRLGNQSDLTGIWSAFLVQWHSGSVWMAYVAIALVPFNWLIETAKWRTLMQPGIILPWRHAIAGILSGITLSMFTPNRTGEYGGRVLYVAPPFRWRAVVASLTGSFAQNVVHIVLGALALACFVGAAGRLPGLLERGIWVFVGSCALGLLLLYFNLPAVAALFAHRTPPRFLRKPWAALAHLRETSQRRLLQALLFSLLRYGTFTFQYVLLLQFFGVDLPWLWLIGGVAVIYLVQTSIPLPPLLDLVARNEVGIILWVGMGANELSIVAAGLVIWIINLAFPALIGLFAIAAVNVLRTFGYDKTILPADTAQRSGTLVDKPSHN